MTENSNSRKSAIKRGLSWFALVAAAAIPFMPKKKTKMVKMLTEDGQLVEVDQALIVSSGKKITNDALKTWVHKN